MRAHTYTGYLTLLFAVCAVFLFPSKASAYLMGDGGCTTDSVSITGISETSSGTPIYSGSLNATSCAGLFQGINDGPANNPDPNIGELEDGFLNGEPVKTGPRTEDGLDPLTFIDSTELQALSGDGIFDDPGWIHLAEIDADSGTRYSFLDTLDLASVLDVSLVCNSGPPNDCKGGTWNLAVDPAAIAAVQAILGPNSFDHLAFVFKSSTAVSIYDFDFIDLAPAIGGGFNFATAYTFTGNWNMDDFQNPNNNNAQGYSHISFWARDPADGTEIPTPGTLVLFGLGLLLLLFRLRLGRA
ncbi:hypothetical protein [Neptunomonas sp. XY-337]|uniref:hypothetical protein n=1 Tax=Neptunomonas sp. XY-337 TaxID=2561897 RepID=UPI0010AB3A49|nr:hypothetical protein [Neptunomonas sp. XY-337]